jgi:hypothetical protein
MKPVEVQAQLDAQAARIKAAGEHIDVTPLMQAAKAAANAVRTAAAQRRDPVGIRVVEKANGVRLTVTGPKAARYRSLLSQELNSRMPSAQAEIRALVTSKVK